MCQDKCLPITVRLYTIRPSDALISRFQRVQGLGRSFLSLGNPWLPVRQRVEGTMTFGLKYLESGVGLWRMSGHRKRAGLRLV